MANTGSGSLATILFLFMFQAALHKGRTLFVCLFVSPLLSERKTHCPGVFSRINMQECPFVLMLCLNARGGPLGCSP